MKKQENIMQNERGISELAQVFELADKDIKSLEVCST